MSYAGFVACPLCPPEGLCPECRARFAFYQRLLMESAQPTSDTPDKAEIYPEKSPPYSQGGESRHSGRMGKARACVNTPGRDHRPLHARSR